MMIGQSKWPIAKTKQKKLCGASQLINPKEHKPILQPFYFFLTLIDSIYSSMNWFTNSTIKFKIYKLMVLW